MELVHKINPNRETWADFLKKTGFDGSQTLDDVRRKCVNDQMPTMWACSGTYGLLLSTGPVQFQP